MKARSLSPLRSLPPLSELPIPDLFKIVRRVDVRGLDGYMVPRQYIPVNKKKQHTSEHSSHRQSTNILDSSLDKTPANKTSEAQSPTRKCFIDDILKIAEGIPGSPKYSNLEKWATPVKEIPKQVSPNKKQAIVPAAETHNKRMTIFEEIHRIEAKNETKKKCKKGQLEAKHANELDRLLSEKKKHLKAAFYKSQLHVDRKTMFDDASVLAESSPGPGNYNTHCSITKIQVDKRDCEYWKAKHSSPSPSRLKTFPGVGTYDHYPASYATFGKIANDQERENSNIYKVKTDRIKSFRYDDDGNLEYLHPGFGTGRRCSPFEPRTNNCFRSAGPGSHNISENWETPNKSFDSQDKKAQPKRGQQPLKNISKGIERSMYYEKLPLIN